MTGMTINKKFTKSVSKGDVVLLTGKIEGKDAWRYLRVEKAKRQSFERAIEKGSLKPNDFGEVLYAGWGENPPVYVENMVNLEEAD